MSNAGWALRGTIISGSLIPFSSRARSRAVFTAIRMLSVPPEVMLPTAAGSLSSPAVMATTSDSNFLRLLKASGPRPFVKIALL